MKTTKTTYKGSIKSDGSRYQLNKAKAVAFAIDFQHKQSERAVSLGEIMEDARKLEKLARRYGLVKEFRENAII